jgi:hypothetical protein
MERFERCIEFVARVSNGPECGLAEEHDFATTNNDASFVKEDVSQGRAIAE